MAPLAKRFPTPDLINVNCFPAKQQLAFCSNDESSISSNRGNYVELLHTLAAKDERLAVACRGGRAARRLRASKAGGHPKSEITKI